MYVGLLVVLQRRPHSGTGFPALFNSIPSANLKMQVPGLYKIFDEILVNAADNKQRDNSMDRIDVIIDPAKNTISVRNNGGCRVMWAVHVDDCGEYKRFFFF